MKRHHLMLIQSTLSRSSGLLGDCLHTFLENYVAGSTSYLDFVSGNRKSTFSSSNVDERRSMLNACYKNINLRFELLCKYFESSLHEQLHAIVQGSKPKLHRNWIQIEQERHAIPYVNLLRLESRIEKVCQDELQQIKERLHGHLFETESLPLTPRTFAIALKDCLEHGLVSKNQVVFAFDAIQLDFVFRLRLEMVNICESLPTISDFYVWPSSLAEAGAKTLSP